MSGPIPNAPAFMAASQTEATVGKGMGAKEESPFAPIKAVDIKGSVIFRRLTSRIGKHLGHKEAIDGLGSHPSGMP